jgi:hypothetical protein
VERERARREQRRKAHSDTSLPHPGAESNGGAPGRGQNNP